MKFSLQILALYPLIQAITCFKSSVVGHPKFNPRDDVIPSKYLLEFDSSASASYLDSLKDSQDLKVHHTYDHEFFRGLSIEIMNAENEDSILKSILDHPGIAYVTPNQIVKGASTTIQNHLNVTAEDIKNLLPHELHQVDRVKKELNLTGEGVFVGIIDTGIDYRLPALGGCFGKGCKVAAGWDFVGYNDTNNDGSPLEDSDPLELCPAGSPSEGHGTHVAGIIGGYDPELNFEGVAPGATLGMWRALGCDKSGSTDSIMKSALAAFDAGVDILSLSIGNSKPWANPELPDYKVFKQIADSGVLVVIAASNDGLKGSYSVTSFAPNSFSVASIVNKYKPNPLNFRATGVAGPIHSQPLLFINDTRSSFVDGDLLIPFVKTNISDEVLFPFCTTDFPANQVKGKIVAISATTLCPTTLKSLEELGAAGAIIFYDNELETTPGNSHIKTIPVTAITVSSFKALYDAYKKNNGQVRIEYSTPDSAIAYNEFENTVSLFSSVGPTGDLAFTPNIAAVGENVYSTVPIQFGRMAFMSGTSMATPYISGTLALYLQYHGKDKTKRDIIRAKYQNYATIASLTTKSSGVLDNPLRQGSGYVQVYDSITQSVYVTPPDVTFKDSSFVEEKTQELSITNEGSEAVTYKLYNNASIAVAPYNREVSGYKVTSPSGNAEAKAEITFSQTEITVNPGETQTITVTVVPPSTNPLDHIMYGGFVQFNPVSAQGSVSSHKPIHVPYFGIVGNQKDLPILDTATINFEYQGPTLNYTHTGADEHPPKIVHTLNAATTTNETAPFIGITFNILQPTELIMPEIIDASSGEIVGYLPPVPYSGIISPAQSAEFDGTYCLAFPQTSIGAIFDSDEDCDSVIASGTYAIRINGLKLNGVISNKEDYDSWTSIPFTIEVQTA